MSSSLSGIDTGLESFLSGDMDMSDSLLGDVSKDMVMTGDTVDVAPKPMQRSAMEYPKKARAQGVTGYVLMNLLITNSGRVETVKVLESTPEGVFDEVAVAGVKTWMFEPALYQGKAVKVWAKQKVRFDLQ
jgi:protein TonB